MAKKITAEIKAVTDWAAEAGTAGWKVAAMCRSAGWTMDKQVTSDQYDSALEHFNSRRMGG